MRFGLKNIAVLSVLLLSSFQLYADYNTAASLYERGFKYENGNGFPQNYTEAIKCYRQAAEMGHLEARFRLGRCYERGLGVAKNYQDAVKHYLIATKIRLVIFSRIRII